MDNKIKKVLLIIFIISAVVYLGISYIKRLRVERISKNIDIIIE